ATRKPRSRKRTYAFAMRSMRTLRFLLIARAGRWARIDGRQVLRLTQNPATEALYSRVFHALGASVIFGSGLTVTTRPPPHSGYYSTSSRTLRLWPLSGQSARRKFGQRESGG